MPSPPFAETLPEQSTWVKESFHFPMSKPLTAPFGEQTAGSIVTTRTGVASNVPPNIPSPTHGASPSTIGAKTFSSTPPESRCPGCNKAPSNQPTTSTSAHRTYSAATPSDQPPVLSLCHPATSPMKSRAMSSSATPLASLEPNNIVCKTTRNRDSSK